MTDEGLLPQPPAPPPQPGHRAAPEGPGLWPAVCLKSRSLGQSPASEGSWATTATQRLAGSQATHRTLSQHPPAQSGPRAQAPAPQQAREATEVPQAQEPLRQHSLGTRVQRTGRLRVEARRQSQPPLPLTASIRKGTGQTPSS